ncbi:MAG TPA: polysaccharide biosynthesis/export family protein [Methylomusa anaerophila]|uniref:Polysialic acid transport protein KpsD n=1 Tax=Methylomusa anaerophila TaxID=1930071 RepID=A0A348AI16_9FIRM|nr:polysaccharide biosynthesis/export family protein [Methylomusa anaerophila]BBB90714.1 polysialic acid transport protein KpsD precursor [Methylomusa anaerophila]HML88683.1 polysaccharide biosynthesis/export family protein [Methylomusa anaerophila]
MKQKSTVQNSILGLFFLLLVLMPVYAACAEEYHLGVGDVFTVSVWGLDELQVEDIIVGAEGNINFPVVGQLKVAGLSTNDLAANIAAGLAKYVRDPKVSVIITKYRTTRVYVLGEVVKPGMYEIEKYCNILDALGAAGGYTDKAAKRNVFVIRSNQQGKPLKVNLLNLLNKGDMSQNYALGDGDVLYLTPNNKIDISSIISTSLTFSRGSASYQVGSGIK